MTRGGPATASTTLAIWSYQLGFGSLLPDFSSAAAVGNVLIIIAVIFGLDLHPRPQPTGGDMKPARSWWLTAVGVLFTAVDALPRLLDDQRLADEDIEHAQEPAEPDPDRRDARGLRGRHPPAAAVPRHQPAHRARHGRAHARARRAGRVLAGQAAAARRRRAELRAADRADDPGDRHGDGLLRDLPQARHPQHGLGPDPRRLDHRRAVRRAHLHRVHVAASPTSCCRPPGSTAPGTCGPSCRSSCR